MSAHSVALRKESVDRNSAMRGARCLTLVALRKESVDRNRVDVTKPVYTPSLSARRAWIEIMSRSMVARAVMVALRKESVDRNARLKLLSRWDKVALRKESVDRNTNDQTNDGFYYRRSPQGERG